jgi:DNA-binding NtrC family response regulator
LSAIARWSAGGGSSRKKTAQNSKEKVVKETLEALVSEMIERRIYLGEAVGEFEKKFIQTALTKTRGNQTKAAQVLGVHRNTLNRKIAQHKLNGHR